MRHRPLHHARRVFSDEVAAARASEVAAGAEVQFELDNAAGSGGARWAPSLSTPL